MFHKSIYIVPIENSYYTIQYNTIQYNTIQYNTIQYYTILYNTILYYTILYNTIQYYTILYNNVPSTVDPGFYSTNLLYLGKTHLGMGQKEEARKWLTKTVQFDGPCAGDVEDKIVHIIDTANESNLSVASSVYVRMFCRLNQRPANCSRTCEAAVNLLHNQISNLHSTVCYLYLVNSIH